MKKRDVIFTSLVVKENRKEKAFMMHKDEKIKLLKELEEEIRDMLVEMRMVTNDSSEYENLLRRLEKLVEIRDKHFKNGKNHINWDSVLVVGGNLAGILLILKYEEVRCLTSRAVQFVLKGRV